MCIPIVLVSRDQEVEQLVGGCNSLRPLGSHLSEKIRPPSYSQFSSLVLLLFLPGDSHLVEMVVKQERRQLKGGMVVL